jgi:hypothetical protein
MADVVGVLVRLVPLSSVVVLAALILLPGAEAPVIPLSPTGSVTSPLPELPRKTLMLELYAASRAPLDHSAPIA